MGKNPAAAARSHSTLSGQPKPPAPGPRRPCVTVGVAAGEQTRHHNGSGSRSGSSGASSSGGGDVQAELAELRQMLMEQQRTIARLEEQLVLRNGQAGAAGEPGQVQAAAAAAAGAAHQPHHLQQHDHQQQQQQQPQPSEPLDGPEAIMEPTALEQRVFGTYSARYHSTTWGTARRDLALLPRRIILVRHAQSKGNVDPFQYCHVPDNSVPLTRRGWEQAIEVGEQLHALLSADGPIRLFCYTSPFLRCKQTVEGLLQSFSPHELLGVQEEVMLREQDFGGTFQDAEAKRREKQERLRYGRFFYRFPAGESGADVHKRMTLFQDHLVRDMDAGRFGEGSTLLLVTHGLASRIWLMRWFHWTVEQFLSVWNPENAQPIVLERIPDALVEKETHWMHTKALYRMSEESRGSIPGITGDMCATTWAPRGLHWHDESEAWPEDAPHERRHTCSVSYQ